MATRMPTTGCMRMRLPAQKSLPIEPLPGLRNMCELVRQDLPVARVATVQHNIITERVCARRDGFRGRVRGAADVHADLIQIDAEPRLEECALARTQPAPGPTGANECRRRCGGRGVVRRRHGTPQHTLITLAALASTAATIALTHATDRATRISDGRSRDAGAAQDGMGDPLGVTFERVVVPADRYLTRSPDGSGRRCLGPIALVTRSAGRGRRRTVEISGNSSRECRRHGLLLN